MRASRPSPARVAAIILAFCAVTACNTVEGIGKDIKKAGEAIEGAGDKGRK